MASNAKLGNNSGLNFNKKHPIITCVCLMLMMLTSGLSYSIGLNITICSVEQARGNSGSLDGPWAFNLRSKLMNPANFGPAGLNPTTFTIVDSFGAVGSITNNSLAVAGCEIFYKGNVASVDFTNAEVSALIEWVSVRGGTLLEFTEGNGFDLISTAFGHDTTDVLADGWLISPAQSDHPFFDGVFGTPNPILSTQGQKAIYNNSNNARVLAEDVALGRPAIMEKRVDNGQVLFFSDVNAVTTLVSVGNGNNSSQDHFALNLFAYAASTYNTNNYVPSTPVITAPADNTVSTDFTPAISGTADPGTTVVITTSNAERCRVTADFSTGVWGCFISPSLPHGTSIIEARSEFNDISSAGVATITYTVDNVDPEIDSCTVQPDPANNGTAVDAICTGVEIGASLSIPGYACVDLGGGTWRCAGTVGVDGVDGDEIATAMDIAGNTATTPANFTLDNDPPVVGTCVVSPNPANNGTIVTALCDGIEIGSTLTIPGYTCDDGEDGLWKCEATVGVAGVDGDEIATVTDAAGNTTTTPATFTLDNTPPAIGTCDVTPDPANDGTPLTANCNGVGADATLTIPGYTCNDQGPGNTWVCTGTAGVDGVDGDEIATATDAAGNSATTPATFTLDNDAPGTAVFTAISDDTGSSNTDYITFDDTLVITGTGEPEATIEVYINELFVGRSEVNELGEWSFDHSGTALGEGSFDLLTEMSDSAGNTGPLSAPQNVLIDQTAPEMPIIDEPTNGTPATGTGEIGATVSVSTPSGSTCEAVVQPDGIWSCFLAGPPVHGEDISASQEDAAGNISPITTVSTGIDTEPPGTAAFTAISDDTGSSDTDYITFDDTLMITGTGEPEATIELYINGLPVGTSDVNELGEWSFDHSGTALGEGSFDLLTEMSDSAGNTGPLSVPQNVLIDQTAPEMPIIDEPTNGTPVTGTGEIGATVSVSTPSGSACGALVDGNGDWTCTLSPEPSDQEIISASQTDIAGNESEAAMTTVDYLPDLMISMTNCIAGVGTGDELLYEITIENIGNIDVIGAELNVLLGMNVSTPDWSCTPTGEATCNAENGTGDLINEPVNLPVASQLFYVLDTTVTGNLQDIIEAQATVDMPIGVTDVNINNNAAEDADLIYQFIFKDTFDCANNGSIDATQQQMLTSDWLY